MPRQFIAAVCLAALAAVSLAACVDQKAATPTSPSDLTPPVAGVSLKATAPALQSPASGATIAQGQSVTLVVANATTDATGVALSYRFEVSNTTGTVVETTLVPSGAGTTSRTVAAILTGGQTYQWRVRAEYQGSVGPWSSTASFVAPANDGYIHATELYDPLTNGKTVGTIGGSGNVTFLAGKGIQMNDELAYVVYPLPQTYSSGEMSVEVTGLGPDGPPGAGKPRIFSMLDQPDSIASSSAYSFNVQYRGAGGAPANCITFKAILGDNANSVEPDDRFDNVFLLDPSTVYLWQAFWTPTSFELRVRVGGPTGPVLIDDKELATSGTTNWNPAKMFAFLGTNNGQFVDFDGTRIGMVIKNVWVSSNPRPATLP
jgi:opacity protein-like surface antigen